MTQQILDSPHSPDREKAIRANRWVYRLSRYWLWVFSVIFGLYVGLPFLAPVFMNLGLEFPARVIYTIYSFLCHQLPQRSFFLFGQQFTYHLADIQAAWGDTANLAVLRQFIGTSAMGWKVAWSDRMVSMYTSILLFAWIWYPLRRRIPRLRWPGLVVLVLPMAVDGLTHLVSDLAGLGHIVPMFFREGFRDTNSWLAALTNHAFEPSFYAGDAWGSFNSLMRLVTGILFGTGIVWFGFPYVDDYFEEMKNRVREKFQRAGIRP